MNFKIEKNIPLRQGGEKSNAPSLELGDRECAQEGNPASKLDESSVSNLPHSDLVGESPTLDTYPVRAKRGRKPKCRSNTDHVWEALEGILERCIKCGNHFPCDEDCFHYECLEALGKPLPDWYEVISLDETPASE